MRFGAMGLPSFHAMGLLLQLTFPLATGREVVVYTPQWPAPPVVAHPQNVYEVAKLMKCTALLALPSYIEVSDALPWAQGQSLIRDCRHGRIRPRSSSTSKLSQFW